MVRRSTKLLLMIAAVFVVALVGWFTIPHASAPAAQAESGGDRNQAASANGGKAAQGGRQAAQATESGPPPAPVLVAEAQTQDVPIVIRGIGSVLAYNTVAVKSRVDGNIVKVGFNEGQFVHAGDLLMQVDPRPFQAQLDQAVANQGKDAANLENARRDLARYAALLPSQLAVTRQQYDTQRALVAQLEAAVKSDEAAVETARLNLDYSSIRSPIDGVTGLRQVDIGNLVQASAMTTLVVVAQIRPIGVVFTIPERDLGRLRERLTPQGLPVLAFNGDDDKQVAAGVLSVLNNQVDQSTGMVTLKAAFPNEDAALWPGEFVNAHLVLDIVKNGVTVPSGAIQMGPQGAFVYLVKPDSTAEARSVTVVQTEDSAALIGKGLAAGDRVVVSGQDKLATGTKVAVQQGAPGQSIAKETQLGLEGIGTSGTTSGPVGGISPR